MRGAGSGGQGRGLDVWTYTGYTYEALRAEDRPDFRALLSATDVLVDGPFLVARKSYAALFRGSDNQRLIDLGLHPGVRPDDALDPAGCSGALCDSGILRRAAL